jgi:hypothetical protein
MDERGVQADRSSLNRWVLKYVPLREQTFPGRGPAVIRGCDHHAILMPIRRTFRFGVFLRIRRRSSRCRRCARL